MKKFVNILGLFLILGIAFSSCKEDPLYTEPTPTVKVTSIAVEGLTANVLTLEKSKTHQIKIAFNPTNATDIKDYTFTYKSADAKVATVSATGLVTAVAAGDVMITVTPKNNAKLEKNFKVVVPESFISVESITIAATALKTVEVGKTIPLTNDVTVLPATASNKAVTYTSSDVTKATVSNTGVVTGVAAGEVTITIASVEKPAIKVTHKVTVEGPAVIAVESVTATGPGVADNKLELEVAKTAALTTTVLPATATNKEVTYTSSTPATATVSADGVITAVAEGTTTITVASKADATKKQEIVVTVKAPAPSSIVWAPRTTWAIGTSHPDLTAETKEDWLVGSPASLIDESDVTCLLLVKPGKKYPNKDGEYPTDLTAEPNAIIFFTADLKAATEFNRILLQPRLEKGPQGGVVTKVKLEGSNDGTTWTAMEDVTIEFEKLTTPDRKANPTKLASTYTYKHVKVTYLEYADAGGSTAQVADFKLGLEK